MSLRIGQIRNPWLRRAVCVSAGSVLVVCIAIIAALEGAFTELRDEAIPRFRGAWRGTE